MSAATLLSALLLGVLGGVHCVAMCGGIAGVLCGATPSEARRSPLRQLPYALGYNTGRVLSYACAGLLAGWAGAAAGGAMPAWGATALRVLAGVVMVCAGLYLAGVLRGFARVERVGRPLWRRIEPVAKRLLPVKSPLHATMLGVLWGWLPCGTVYAALVLALGSGSALSGALTMAAFGAGTLPVMLALSALASGMVKLAHGVALKRAAGFLIATFGVLALLAVVVPVPWMPRAGGPAAAHCHCHG